MAGDRIVHSMIVDEEDAHKTPIADEDLVVWDLLDSFLVPYLNRDPQEFHTDEDTTVIRWHTWTRQEADVLLTLARAAASAAGWEVCSYGAEEIL